MVVIVMDPDRDGLSPFVLGLVGAGVEALVGQDPLVPLDLPVMAGSVDPRALVASDERAGRAVERRGGVVRAVVGDQAGDPGDAVGSEEGSGAVEEGDGRDGFLVLERLGVGQAGEPVDDRVEVGVADLLLVGAFAGEGLFAAAAVGPPAAAVGDLPDLLHVHVDHVARVAGDDLPWSAKVLAVWGDVADPIQSEPVQPARHRSHATAEAVPVGELAGDTARGPLLRPSPGLDQLEHPDRETGRAVRWRAGVVLQAELAVLAEASDPFRERGAGDVELGGDVRDGATDLDDLRDSALSSDDGQWGITVVHGTGLFLRDGCFDTTHRAGQGPVPSSPTRCPQRHDPQQLDSRPA